MANIKMLKNSKLIDGESTYIYPITLIDAIYDDENKTKSLRDILNEKGSSTIDDEVIKQIRKDLDSLLPDKNSWNAYISLTVEDNKQSPLEIDGKWDSVTLTAKGYGTHYYDKEFVKNIASSNIKIYINGVEVKDSELEDITETSKTCKTTIKSDSVTSKSFTVKIYDDGKEKKSASTSFSNYIKSYYGFYEGELIKPENLPQSSSNIKGTITINKINDDANKAYVYFAVPSSVSISKVIQPDGNNFPLDIKLINSNFVRIFKNGTTFKYNLYRSVDMLNANRNKRLTLS